MLLSPMKIKQDLIKLGKKLLDALLERLVTIVISLVIAGGFAGCNHMKIEDSNKWIGQHLEDKQQQIDQLKGSE